MLECAPFGREVHKFNENSDDKEKISLGCIYHMRQAEAKKDVPLSLKNLASHTFITGSTGSGKSYTVYKMLSELKEKEIKDMILIVM